MSSVLGLVASRLWYRVCDGDTHTVRISYESSRSFQDEPRRCCGQRYGYSDSYGEVVIWKQRKRVAVAQGPKFIRVSIANHHNEGSASRYPRSRLRVTLAYQESQPNQSFALKRELAIKDLLRKAKEALIAGQAD